jgi:hypothetical protein
MKSRWPAVCLWLLSGLAWGLAWGQPAPQGGSAVAAVADALGPEQQRSERERLAQARAAQQARWAEREQACSRLFWVNDCLRQAKLEYRQAMSEIERQQTRLEQGIRQQRASELAQRINSRTQERIPQRIPEPSEPPQEREQRQVGAAEHNAAAERAQIVAAQPMPVQQTVQQQDQQQEQRQDRRQVQAGERLLKQEQRQEQASARAQRREQSAQAAQAAQAARLERYTKRAAASDEAPP